MHQEIDLLVNAINGLKQDQNIFKDYIFPIASALFTSLLGAGIAFFTLRHQEGVQIEKTKIDTTNKWTLLAEEARSSLIAIKGNYHEKLTENPFQRMSAVPIILFHATPIAVQYEELYFITSKASQDSVNPEKWSQIPRIRAMISNYNYVLELWKQRNQIERPIREQIIAKVGGKSYVNMDQATLLKFVSGAELSIVIDITERLIKLTDDLIIELDDFMSNFPEMAESLINTKRLKRYGSVLKYSNNGNQLLLNIIRKTPEVDYSSVESLFGESSDQLRQRHRTGY